MLVYHGVSDQTFSVKDTERWCRGVDHRSGGRAEDFVRLYDVTGMGHCSSGPATDQADFITPLVKWVEQGKAPQSIVASARGAGNVGGVNADLPAVGRPTARGRCARTRMWPITRDEATVVDEVVMRAVAGGTASRALSMNGVESTAAKKVSASVNTVSISVTTSSSANSSASV